MNSDEVPPTDWDGLLKWYLSADPLISGLDTCSEIVRLLSDGTAEANLLVAEALSAITYDNELWLLAHPCPEDWNRKYLSNINEMFIAIGELVVTVGGSTPRAVADALTRAVAEACTLVGGVHQTVHRLTIANIS